MDNKKRKVACWINTTYTSFSIESIGTKRLMMELPLRVYNVLADKVPLNPS